MTKVRVLHLLTSFQVGGAETMALELGRTMDPSTYRILTCSLSGAGPMASQFRRAGIETFDLSRAGAMRRLGFRLLFRLARLLRRERVSVLHCHNSFPRLYGTMAAGLAGVPVVVATQHAVWFDGQIERPPLLARVMNPFVTHFVAVAKSVERAGVHSGHIRRGRCSVIYNGIDLDRFSPSRRRKLPESEVVLGCVGRLSREKRHNVILRATAQLARNGCNVRLHIVGDGPLRSGLEAQGRSLGLEEHIGFFGLRNDVAQLLRSMDIFILASATEGLPLTVIEGMASGLPVVATRVGGVPELVEEGRNGFLVPPDDAQALSAAIERLIQKPELRRTMGAEGRKMAVEKFSLELCAHRHEQLYLRLLEEKGFCFSGQK